MHNNMNKNSINKQVYTVVMKNMQTENMLKKSLGDPSCFKHMISKLHSQVQCVNLSRYGDY